MSSSPQLRPLLSTSLLYLSRSSSFWVLNMSTSASWTNVSFDIATAADSVLL